MNSWVDIECVVFELVCGLDVGLEVPAEDIGFGVSSFEVGRTVVTLVDIKFVVPGLVCGVLLAVCEVNLEDIGFGVSPIEVGPTVVPWVDIK